MTAVSGEMPVAGASAKRRSLVPILVVAAIVVAGGIYGWRRFQFARHHVTTDNAQIDGHITAVSPRVQGFVARVLIDDNQHVKAGDTLVVLDDRDFRVRLDQAEADLASVQAQVGRGGQAGQANAEAASRVAQAGSAAAEVTAARAALAKAESDLKRYQSLADRKIIPPQQLDQATWAVESAKAGLEAAQGQAAAASSQSKAAQAGVRVANARLSAAKAQVENARLQLGYTVILASASGVVAERAVEPGTLVQVGQSLLSIVPDEQVWVTANLKETELARVSIGAPVEFSVDAYPGATFHGTVESVSPATGARFALLPPDNATGNFTKVVQRVPVRIAVDPGQDEAHPLRPGMSVDVSIVTN